MSGTIRMYAVVDREGGVRGPKKGAASLYRTYKVAKTYAKNEGDCVVEVFIDLSLRPLFINGEVLDGDS